jgi:hypothetical protein
MSEPDAEDPQQGGYQLAVAMDIFRGYAPRPRQSTKRSPRPGPAVSLAFALASVACFFAGLCYAEFAAMVPVSGSAYSYAYATLGELVAWIIGWSLIVCTSNSDVAKLEQQLRQLELTAGAVRKEWRALHEPVNNALRLAAACRGDWLSSSHITATR